VVSARLLLRQTAAQPGDSLPQALAAAAEYHLLLMEVYTILLELITEADALRLEPEVDAISALLEPGVDAISARRIECEDESMDNVLR